MTKVDNQTQEQTDQAIQSNTEPDPVEEPKEVKKEVKSETNGSIYDAMIKSLRSDIPDAPDLSFLKKEDQIKTLMSLKDTKKTEQKKEPTMDKTPENPPTQNPAQSPAQPEVAFQTLAERNKVGGDWYNERILDRKGIGMYRGRNK